MRSCLAFRISEEAGKDFIMFAYMYIGGLSVEAVSIFSSYHVPRYDI